VSKRVDVEKLDRVDRGLDFESWALTRCERESKLTGKCIGFRTGCGVLAGPGLLVRSVRATDRGLEKVFEVQGLCLKEVIEVV
jgi:hypothetical protein